jgi:hypothetical protein
LQKQTHDHQNIQGVAHAVADEHIKPKAIEASLQQIKLTSIETQELRKLAEERE